MPTIPLPALMKANPALFDNMETPPTMDKQLLIDTIVLRAAPLSCIYSDPVFFQSAIGVWSRRRSPMWARMYDTTNLEYNPIENYDRQEEWEDSAEGGGTTTATDAKTAFDSDAFKDAARSTSEGDSRSSSRHKGHTHGNIGVTTSQQMIEAERAILDYDAYNAIAVEFVAEFCIGIYY